METTVTIESVEGKSINTRRGPSTVYNVETSDGKRYSTFDSKLAESAATLRGKTAVIEYQVRENVRDGKTYVNHDLKGVQPAISPADIVPVQITETPRIDSQKSDKDLSIARSVALKAAVDTATGLQWTESPSAPVLSLADEYLDWLLNGSKKPAQTVTDPPTTAPGGTGETEDEFVDAGMIQF